MADKEGEAGVEARPRSTSNVEQPNTERRTSNGKIFTPGRKRLYNEKT